MMVQHVRRCREFTGPTPHSVAIVSVEYFHHFDVDFVGAFNLGALDVVAVLFGFKHR